MTLYTENSKDFTKKKKKLLEIIREYSEAAGYKVHIQKSAVFLHELAGGKIKKKWANNELAGGKIKKKSHLFSQQKE